MSDNLTDAGLSWSITHVRKYGDTDVFPIPFEYAAIAHDWNTVRQQLSSVDLTDYRVRPDRRVLAMKPGGGFRAAFQLDPIDHLMYTAAIYESADAIERARVPKDHRVACSYRVEITPEGAFFQPDNGWKDFQEHSRELANSKAFSHVLLADISDFYNQLGQHRVQNALEMAGVPLERSKNIEEFLSQLSAKQSQGLPVGPYASILLAEATLIDVDNFLLRIGVPHVRYVDDFRIFCVSRKQAIDVRHALTEYLFSVHRLSLEASKTSVLFVDRFKAEELPDAEDQEQEAELKKLNELLDAFFAEHSFYGLPDLAEPDQDELLSQAAKESFVELFERCIASSYLHVGLARHLLRKALRGRTVVLNDLVIKNIEKLAPVMRDVVRYLAATIPKKSAAKRGRQLLQFASESDISDLPFVRMWLIDLFLQRPDLSDASHAMQLAESSKSSLGIRASALMAAAYNQLDWVRFKKETWRNHELWDRRALIWASSILPSGERRPLLGMIEEQGDILDSAIAKFLLSR